MFAMTNGAAREEQLDLANYYESSTAEFKFPFPGQVHQLSQHMLQPAIFMSRLMPHIQRQFAPFLRFELMKNTPSSTAVSPTDMDIERRRVLRSRNQLAASAIPCLARSQSVSSVHTPRRSPPTTSLPMSISDMPVGAPDDESTCSSFRPPDQYQMAAFVGRSDTDDGTDTRYIASFRILRKYEEFVFSYECTLSCAPPDERDRIYRHFARMFDAHCTPASRISDAVRFLAQKNGRLPHCFYDFEAEAACDAEELRKMHRWDMHYDPYFPSFGRKQYDPEYEGIFGTCRRTPSYSIFANSVIQLMSRTDRYCFVYGKHFNMLVIWFAVPSTFDESQDLKPNVLIAGPAAGSKSYIMQIILALFGPEFLDTLTYSTAKAGADPTHRVDIAKFFEEMPRNYGIAELAANGKNGDPTSIDASALRRDELTRQAIGVYALAMDDNGRRQVVFDVLRTGFVVGATNYSLADMSPAMRTRFIPLKSNATKKGDKDKGKSRTRTGKSLPDVEGNRDLGLNEVDAKGSASFTEQMNHRTFHIARCFKMELSLPHLFLPPTMLVAIEAWTRLEDSLAHYNLVDESSPRLRKHFLSLCANATRMHALALVSVYGGPCYCRNITTYDMLVHVNPRMTCTWEIAIFFISLLWGQFVDPILPKVMTEIFKQYLQANTGGNDKFAVDDSGQIDPNYVKVGFNVSDSSDFLRLTTASGEEIAPMHIRNAMGEAMKTIVETRPMVLNAAGQLMQQRGGPMQKFHVCKKQPNRPGAFGATRLLFHSWSLLQYARGDDTMTKVFNRMAHRSMKPGPYILGVPLCTSTGGTSGGANASTGNFPHLAKSFIFPTSTCPIYPRVPDIDIEVSKVSAATMETLRGQPATTSNFRRHGFTEQGELGRDTTRRMEIRDGETLDQAATRFRCQCIGIPYSVEYSAEWSHEQLWRSVPGDPAAWGTHNDYPFAECSAAVMLERQKQVIAQETYANAPQTIRQASDVALLKRSFLRADQIGSARVARQPHGAGIPQTTPVQSSGAVSAPFAPVETGDIVCE